MHFSKAFLGVVPALFLSGCFLTNMEKNTEDMKASVEDTNRKLDETKNGQSLGAALELLSDPTKSVNVRAAAAETVFTKGAEDRVGLYVGMPSHIKLPMVNLRFSGRGVQVPNVTIVSEKNQIDAEVGVAPINPDLFSIVSHASIAILEKMSLKANLPGLSAEDLATLRTTAQRMILLTPGILGACDLEQMKASLRGTRGRHFKVDAPVRQYAGNLLYDLAKKLSLDEPTVNELKAIAEVKLGISLN